MNGRAGGSTKRRRRTITTDLLATNIADTPSNKVHSFILGKIQSGEWPLNSKIMTENRLCETLGVSRVAVREAIERLSALGLLSKKQGSGTFVAEVRMADFVNSLFPVMHVDKKDILTILEFRRCFEFGMVDMFTKHHTPEELQSLEANFIEYSEAIAAGNADPERTGELDYQFHRIIALGTHNVFAIKTCEMVMEIMRQHLLYFSVSNTCHTEEAVQYHREIVRAIKMGESAIAAQYMRRHIELVIERISGSIA